MGESKQLLPLMAWTFACLPCVAAGTLVPLLASGAVCGVMLLIIVTMIVVGFMWKDIRQNWVNKNRKVKMPKSYFRKKEEAKKRLINGSVGSRTPSTHATPLPSKTVDKASWVEGWNQEIPVGTNVYEEQDVTMELGDEYEKEFRIETSIIDDEILDVGPYKSSSLPDSARSASGNVYSDPYIYTTSDRAGVVRSTETSGSLVSPVYSPDVYIPGQDMCEAVSNSAGNYNPGSMVSPVSSPDVYIPSQEMTEIVSNGARSNTLQSNGYEEQLVKF